MSVAPWRERAIEHGQAVDRARSRSLKTIDSIVSAARLLTIERRGETFTTDELVARSGHSLQTIYRYFRSKDEVLLAVFEEAIAVGTVEIRESVESIESPVQRLQRIIELSIPNVDPENLGIDAALLVSVHTQLTLRFPDEVEYAQRRFVELVRQCINDMVETGAIEPRISVDDDARLITYLVRSTYQALVLARVEGRAAMAAHVAQFCLSALGVREHDVERHSDG